MNQLLGWLTGGDLRSDGQAREVAQRVLDHPDLFLDLFEGLGHSDELVRGRTADALERISRSRPDLLVDLLPDLLHAATQDPIPMVRWHLAMVFGNLTFDPEVIVLILPVLIEMLADESVFVRSWAISSLAMIGRQYPLETARIVELVSTLTRDSSIALRTRAAKALEALTQPTKPFPKGWVKSVHIQGL